LERFGRNEENRFEIRKYLMDDFGNKRLLKGQIAFSVEALQLLTTEDLLCD
jgi:hypothetical protein